MTREEGGPRAFERWAPLLPAAALVLVALLQITLAKRARLTPWKGGGFGMFSSLDARPHRYLRVWVEGPGRSHELGVPAWLQRRAVEAETLPTPGRLDAVARAVMEAERVWGRPVDAVHVELWRDVHDPKTLRATSRKVVEHVRRDVR